VSAARAAAAETAYLEKRKRLMNRMVLIASAFAVSLGLLLASGSFAQEKKDTMAKDDMMKKDKMTKGEMKKGAMGKDTMKKDEMMK
jgi:pentapeptide MXKDX repeat protein